MFLRTNRHVLLILLAILAKSFAEGEEVVSEVAVSEVAVSEGPVESACKPEDYRSIVSIRDAFHRHICSGSVLNERWILTAAHCLIPGRNLVVYVGAEKTGSASSIQMVKVERISISKNYKVLEHADNIGLIRLSTKIKPSENIEFAKLPDKPITVPMDEYCSGTGARMIGWSVGRQTKPNGLECLQLSVLPVDECVKEYEKYVNVKLSKDVICTNSELLGACNGESGGAIFCKGVLVGVISTNIACGDKSIPEPHARVDKHLKYITKTMTMKRRGSHVGKGPTLDKLVIVSFVLTLYLTFVRFDHIMN